MSDQERTQRRAFHKRPFCDILTIKLTKLLGIADSLSQRLEFMPDTLLDERFRWGPNFLAVFESLDLPGLVKTVDLLDLEQSINLLKVRLLVLLIDVFVIILFFNKNVPQPSLHLFLIITLFVTKSSSIIYY